MATQVAETLFRGIRQLSPSRANCPVREQAFLHVPTDTWSWAKSRARLPARAFAGVDSPAWLTNRAPTAEAAFDSSGGAVRSPTGRMFRSAGRHLHVSRCSARARRATGVRRPCAQPCASQQTAGREGDDPRACRAACSRVKGGSRRRPEPFRLGAGFVGRPQPRRRQLRPVDHCSVKAMRKRSALEISILVRTKPSSQRRAGGETLA